MLFTGWEVRTEKIFCRALKNGTRPKAARCIIILCYEHALRSATIPNKTSATLAKFLYKTQVSKHPLPFPHRTMLFMSLRQRSTSPPTLNIDLGGQRGIFLGF